MAYYARYGLSDHGAITDGAITRQELKIPLDFRRQGSGHGPIKWRRPMSQDTEIAGLLQEMRRQLGEAHSIAKAAELCARDGWPTRALRICLDIEPLIHDANHLLQAAAALNRTRGSGEPTATDRTGRAESNQAGGAK